MKTIATILFALTISLSIFGAVEGQSQIYIEDFEDANVGYTSSITEAINGSDDYFIRTDGSDISASFTNIQGTSFFGAQDIDGLGVDSQQALIFDDIDITDYINLQIRVYLAEDDASDGEEDWDAGDFLHIDYDIDNSGTFLNAIWVESIGGTNNPPRIDTDYDGTGDGTEITDSFAQYNADVSGTGSKIDLKLTFDLGIGDEDIAIDNLEIWGTSVGGTATKLAITEVNDGNPLYENAPFEIVVQAQDAFGNPGTVVTDVDITLSKNSGSGTFSGTTTGTILNGSSQTTISGVIYDTSESGVIIEASDDADFLTSGSSSSLTINDVHLVHNEILADPNSDANGDDNFDTSEDEFLEFVNTSSNNLDISGWTISDAVGVKHTFSEEPATILAPNQAVVVFGGGNPTGSFGGSIVQTAGSLGLNNSNETITVKDDSDNTLINITFPGANNQSETRSPDISGNFTDHTSADSNDNSAFSPGTRIDGSFFQSSETLSVTFDGGEGWRMITAPSSGNTYHDLLADIWTQGTNGADYSGGEPNVMTFNGSAFSAVNDLQSDIMNIGEGFIVYVYSDDDYDQTTQDNNVFPKTLSYTGVPRTGYVEAPLNSGIDSWTLAGNPNKQPIDWDEVSKTDIYGTVYVYDHTYGTIPNDSGDDVAENGTVGGGYRTWNGSSGSLSGGVIAPFQGFWVQNSGSSSSLTFQESDQTTGGTFYTKENEQVISLHLKSEMKNMYNEAFLSFTEFGDLGGDRFDGLKLSPLDHRNYMSLFTEVDGTQMDINNLPIEFYESIQIPLHVQAFEAVESGWIQIGGETTLSWPEMKNIPTEWEITLTDKQLNRTVNLRDSKEYVFEAESSLGKIDGREPFTVFNPVPLRKEKAVSDARFLITINPNIPDGMINNDIPTDFTLKQNYPNPFNPTTNIKFEIAEAGIVNLSVFNVMGQRVATLVSESKAPGTYEISWDAHDMASGVYYYRLRAGGVVFNRQMTLIK